ncbi:MAG: type I restriction-modification enzyme R subunit C-terminal domain-containing protein, partial [bacterium]
GLEEMRLELRGIMRFRQRGFSGRPDPRVIDVMELKDEVLHEEYRVKKLEGLELAAYKERVEKVLLGLFETSDTLQKIKTGTAVTEDDLQSLASLVLMQHPDIDLSILEKVYPETAGQLDLAIRRIIGLDPQYVNHHFTEFVQNHPELKSNQIKFIDLLKNHICRYGGIKKEKLFDAPFTAISSDGVAGVFDHEEVEELFAVLENIKVLV